MLRGSRAAAPLTVARGNPGQSRLIVPGGGSRPQQNVPPSKLIIPGQDRGSKGVSINTQGVPAPQTSQFRPPPGFMDTEDPLSQAAKPLDQVEAQQALGRLRSSAGAWHELAALLPRLAAAGLDSTVVEMETGIERAVQNVWAVSQQVHDSLTRSGELPAAKLAYFDAEEAANMLYHMRFLPVAARPAVAAYIVDQQLDATEAHVLARAVKEQERREGHLEGFTPTPADCLAFKFFRDAQESRVEHERSRLIEKGLAVADSASARAALEELAGGKPDSVVGPDAAVGKASLEIVRLTGEEVEFRPVALAGEMAATPPAAVAAAVRLRQTGIFNAFSLPAEAAGQQFVALPAFRSLLFARSPVALSVEDCAGVPLIMAAMNAKSEEERRRQAGPGLVLLDRQPEGPVDPQAHYVRAAGDGCELAPGTSLAEGEATVGRVLFLCRPPARASAARLDSYSLVSL